ncbi:hypothetical protein HZS_4493 [Henneguya salminicola]|nr:hypothetical protein HZS_4493 [Henneguya salminicola]
MSKFLIFFALTLLCVNHIFRGSCLALPYDNTVVDVENNINAEEGGSPSEEISAEKSEANIFVEPEILSDSENSGVVRSYIDHPLTSFLNIVKEKVSKRSVKLCFIK